MKIHSPTSPVAAIARAPHANAGQSAPHHPQKVALVAKLRTPARRSAPPPDDAKGGRRFPEVVLAEARQLARKSPKTGRRQSLRAIAAELAALGHVGPSGDPYHAGSIQHMLRLR
jgi:hypothetical protein